MFVQEFLREAARLSPARTALIAGGVEKSFGEIDRESDLLAAELQSLGVGRGDRVLAVLENSAEMVVALWATLKAGAVFVPLHSATKAGTLAFILEDSGAACLITHIPFRQRVSDALSRKASGAAAEAPAIVWVGAATGGQESQESQESPKVSVDGRSVNLDQVLARADGVAERRRVADVRCVDQDLALIIYTSGSTGTPKGVMMTHQTVCNNARCIAIYLDAVETDVVLCVLPLSFGYGLFQVLTGALAGHAVLLERSFTFPYEILKQIAGRKVTGLPGVPTIFAKLLELAPFRGFDLSHVRYITNAAAALPPAHIQRLRELLPQAKIYSMYGQTECTRVCFLEPGLIDSKIGSVGKAMPNCETYIVDEEGRRCRPGEVGELVVRGANVMRGYWRRPEETAMSLRDGDIPGEKVLYTGDLFCEDEDGDLYFVSRKDDVFKCRGEKVSPKEIENALFELAEIAEAAVIGVPDPIDGMAIKAFVVLREGATLSEKALRKHCGSRLEMRLVPRFFEFCASLPKTDSGKITRRLLHRAAE